MMRSRDIGAIAILFLALFPYRAGAVAFERDLYYGILNDPGVTRLQEFLLNQKVYSGPVTGNFLTLTREGVKRLQEREGVAPALGYFGSKTRSRANELFAGEGVVSREEQIARLKEQIAAFQSRLKELQEKLVQEVEETTPPEAPPTPPADENPPVFTKPLEVTAGFLNPPFPKGARYPYRAVFDWALDETPASEPFECTPPFPASEGIGKSAEYFAGPLTSYFCTVIAKDQAGNEARSAVTLASPGWVSVNGTSSALFPATAMSLMKLGDIAIHNGTTSDLLFAQLVMKVTDNMNSTLNRNREVIFTLRKGPTTSHDIISKTKLTFNSNPPDPNDPHKYFVNMEFPETLKKGEEKTYGIWVENLDYVISGLLRFEFDKFLSTIGVSPVGGFTFTLTREAK